MLSPSGRKLIDKLLIAVASGNRLKQIKTELAHDRDELVTTRKSIDHYRQCLSDDCEPDGRLFKKLGDLADYRRGMVKNTLALCFHTEQYLTIRLSHPEKLSVENFRAELPPCSAVL